MDLHGTIQTWNRGAEHVYGYTADEAIGRSVRIVLPPDRQAEEFALLDRIAQGERVVGFETIRCRKGGECFPVSLTFSPIRDEAGTVIGASKIARDISQRKSAEERFRLAVEAAPTAMLVIGGKRRSYLRCRIDGRDRTAGGLKRFGDQRPCIRVVIDRQDSNAIDHPKSGLHADRG